jgi:hypothetical protein
MKRAESWKKFRKMRARNGAKYRGGQSVAGDGTLACILGKMHDSPVEFQNTYSQISYYFSEASVLNAYATPSTRKSFCRFRRTKWFQENGDAHDDYL